MPSSRRLYLAVLALGRIEIFACGVVALLFLSRRADGLRYRRGTLCTCCLIACFALFGC